MLMGELLRTRVPVQVHTLLQLFTLQLSTIYSRKKALLRKSPQAVQPNDAEPIARKGFPSVRGKCALPAIAGAGGGAAASAGRCLRGAAFHRRHSGGGDPPASEA